MERDCLIEEDHRVLDGLVAVISLGLLAEDVDDRMVKVYLEMLLRLHVAHGGRVPERLRLHGSLHIDGPTVLEGDNAAWKLHQPVGDDDFLDFVDKMFFIAQHIFTSLCTLYFAPRT